MRGGGEGGLTGDMRDVCRRGATCMYCMHQWIHLTVGFPKCTRVEHITPLQSVHAHLCMLLEFVWAMWRGDYQEWPTPL